jgi:hypothetical protein
VQHGATPDDQQRVQCRTCPERGRPLLLADSSAGCRTEGYTQSLTQRRPLWASTHTSAGCGTPSLTAQGKAGLSMRTAVEGGLTPPAALLEPSGMTRFSTDGWGTDERHIEPEPPVVGQQHAQHIERYPFKLQTRRTR